MKFEDLKLVQKWREYAGPKDERLEGKAQRSTRLVSCCFRLAC